MTEKLLTVAIVFFIVPTILLLFGIPSPEGMVLEGVCSGDKIDSEICKGTHLTLNIIVWGMYPAGAFCLFLSFKRKREE